MHQAFLLLELNVWVNRGVGLALIGLFTFFILNVEKKEFQRLPVIGRLLG
jgi:hypothetical protein